MMELDTKQEETADNTRESVNLAKNAATGNVIGTAKSAVKLSKNKKIRRIILIKLLMPVIIIVVLASSIFSIFSFVGDKVEGIIGGLFQNITDFFDTDYTDGRIIIPDNKINEVIAAIESLGISLDSLKLVGDVELPEDADTSDQEAIKKAQQEALKKYIKAFLEAQVVTQTPYLNVQKQFPSGSTYGSVHIYRASDTNKETELVYTKNDLTQMSVDDARNYFSIDEKGNIIVAAFTTTKVEDMTKNNDNNSDDNENEHSTASNEDEEKQDEDEYKNETEEKETSANTEITTKVIPYKSLVSQYSTSMQFLLYLSMVTQNPDFGLAVSELIKDGEIHLTIMDTKTTTITIDENRYTKHTKTIVEEPVAIGVDPDTDEIIYSETETETHTETDSTTVYTKTKTTTINIMPAANITYAKTWFSEQKIEYTQTTSDIPEMSYSFNEEDEEEPEDEGTWLTNQSRTITESGTIIKYDLQTDTNVVDKTGEKGDPGANYGVLGLGKLQLEDKATFIGLLDTKFKIPNTYRKEAPASNLVSGAEWFFYLLQKDSSSQNIEQVMRYILYKYTGEDYGVTELDPNLFGIKDFRTSSHGANLAAYLRQFSHSGEAPKSSDGKFYKMYGDGVGWPTIGNADLQWKSHGGKFNVPGTVLENGVEKQVPNVQAYVNSYLTKGADAEYTNAEVDAMQIYIETKLVDDIGNEVQKVYYNVVENSTNGLSLSKQQLYALTAIAYNFGYLPERGGYTFKSVYEAGLANYEVNSWQHNKFIWDNWWSKLGGGAAGHIPSRDAAFETYVKGVYDFSKSDAGTVFGRKYYIYYTQAQVNQFNYAPNKSITRTASNEQEIFTYVKGTSGILDAASFVHKIMEDEKWTYSLNTTLLGGTNKSNHLDIEFSLHNTNRVACCATYVSCSLYYGGYLTEDEANSFSYHSSNGLYGYLKNTKGWEEIKSYDSLEAGDIVFMTSPDSGNNIGHVQIYAGDGKWYNAGSTSAMQRVSPYSDNSPRVRFVTAIRPE